MLSKSVFAAFFAISIGAILAVSFQNCGGFKSPSTAVTEDPSTCKVSAAAVISPNGNGNVTIFPYFDAGTAPNDATGIRFKARVETNTSPDIKIIFSAHRLWDPANPGQTYILESNLYSNRYVYTDNVCTTFPPAGTVIQQESAIWISIPDYNMLGKIGARTSNTATFPRQRILIDNIAGLNKIETISQRNITGQDIEVEYVRGPTVTAPNDFKLCTDTADGDVYRIWTTKIKLPAAGTLPESTTQVDFIVPDNRGKYLYPGELMSLFTEFLDDAGDFKAYYWDLEYQTENQTAWNQLLRWQLTRYDGENTATGWGVRLATYNGRNVIEFSNTGPDNYADQMSQVLVLQGPPVPSPDPAPPDCP